MGTTRKFLRNMDKVSLSSLGKATKLQKVVSAVTAMGFVLQPVAAMAETIINPVNGGATVKTNGNVTNVWAGAVVNDVAMNVFKQFDIDAGHIANMYFAKEGGNYVNNLINLVDQKININGVVNAVNANKKIGGNLYFLSSNGIAVGAGGVVNAGSLTLMTPSDRFMKSALALTGTDGAITDGVNGLVNLFDDTKKVNFDGGEQLYLLRHWNEFKNMKVAMNKSGTITVNGNINTTDGIRMKAAHINIGKNDDKTDSTAQAVLNSGIVDFKDIVNIKGTNNQVAVDAGLGNDLKATVTGSGDIVLSAVANTVNENTNFANALGQNVQGYDTVQATVNVGKNAQLIANAYEKTNAENQTETVRGGIDISATATSGGGDAGLLGIDVAGTTAADILGSKIVKTDAKINIDGQLTADSINVAASAENSFEKGSLTEVGGLVKKGIETISDYIPLEQLKDAADKVEIGYAKLASNAEVTIGSTASLTATGEDTLEANANDDGLREGGALNISAISKVSAEVGAEVEADAGGEEGNQGKAATAPTLNKKKGNSLSKIMPAAGVSVVDTDNGATVTINGTLNSNGDANVSAHALSEVEAESGVATIDSDEGSQYVNAAVTVANINNASNVTLNGTTTVAGELNALAAAKNEVTTTASAETTKDSLVSTAVNITEANSSADLTVGGTVNAATMNLAADNTISNEIQAATQVGQSKFQTKSKMSGGALNAIIGKTKSKGKSNSKVDKIGQYISAGAAVNVVDENNSAKVTIKKGAKLTATDNGLDEDGKSVPTINISANNVIEDSFMSATSVVNNYTSKKGSSSSGGNTSTGTSSGTAALASVGFLQADLNNSAQVIIEGSDSNTSAPEIKGANVDINANSSFEYDRLKSMWESLKDDWKDATIDGAIGDLYKKIDAKVNAHKDGDVDDAINIADLISTVETITGIPDTLNGLKEALLAFADISNYTNFYTSASTAGGSAVSGAGNKEQATVSLAGSVNINSIKNNAQVVIGKNAKIEASKTNADNTVTTKGELNITAKAKQHDVALNGKTKYFIPTISNTSGGATAIGGSVGVHDADVNSLIAIGEGASLTANDVNLKAENDLQHTAITFGGGAATNDGITGMFAYMEGQSNSIISVDDEASINAANKLALDATNNSTISNIIFDKTSGGNSAVGAAIGIIDYQVNNIAAVADNDSDATRLQDEEVSNLQNLVQGQLSNEEKAQLGTSAGNGTDHKGTITANEVAINAKTSGTITGVSVAGTSSGASKKGSTSSSGQGFKLPAQISGAGSASVNLVQGDTAALLEGVTVKADGNEKTVSVSASDESMIGAYSGAAALKKQGASANASKFGGTLAGAVGFNGVKTGVTAQIKDTTINGASSIKNIAAREGAVVAAGLSLGVDTTATSGSTSFGLAGSASANNIENTVHAVLNKVKTNNGTTGGDKTNIANIAQDKDIQVAGGITAQYARGGGLGAGVAASYQDVTNDIQSKIIGGDLKNVGKLQAYAASQLVQVGTAVSVGVQQGQSANGVEGSVAINNLTNNVGVTIDGATINANSVEAKAFDGKIESTIAGDETTQNTANKHLSGLATDGFDVTGADAMDDVNVTDKDGNAQGGDVNVNTADLGKTETAKDSNGNDVTKAKDGKSTKSFDANDNKGNLIVTGATSVNVNASTSGTLTAGASVATNNIANSFNTKITGANITTSGADGVSAKAESDTLMVGVAAGVAAAKGQSGGVAAGSAGVMQLKNNTTATIENSTLTTDKVDVDAATKSRLINVAGQVSVGKGYTSIGLAGATNVLNNTTGAYIKGATINAAKANDGIAINVKADNQSKAYAIVGAVTVATNQSSVAANGTVAVNKGTNNTEAIVDDATVTDNGQQQQKENTFTNVKNINVNAKDATTMKAIAGGVVVGKGYASVGGAVAYNEIGDFTSSGEGKKQNTIARLNKAAITTVQNSSINVNAEDKSNLLTIAAGVSVSTGQQGAAAQGSAATALVNKNTEASMTGTSVSKANDDGADVNVNAKTESEIITSADAISATTANAAGGAGVAVNRTAMDTKAFIDGNVGNKSITAKSVGVKADSKADIINVGIGAALTTGQGGSAAGNVSINNIDNDTEAGISNANITTTGNTAVLAKSEEHIKNYAGALAATVGQGYVAGGASVAVNTITGNTKASVNNSTINAGNVADISFADISFADKNSKGLVVAADSDHEIDNVVITAGIAATAEVGVAASGTVAVNTIKGATTAEITNSNTNTSGTAGDVNVIADDSTDINSAVGALAVGVGAGTAGVAAGASSDTNVLAREVMAQVVGDSTNKNTVNADKLNVNAKSVNKVVTTAVGAAAAGGLYGAAGVAGTVSVTKTDATTLAKLANVNSNNNGFAIDANRTNNIKLTGASAAASVAIGAGSLGMTIGVMSDSSTTSAELDNVNITHNNTAEAEDKVHAESTTNVTTALVSEAVSASIGGAIGGVVGVNNLDNKVLTTVNNSKIAAEGNNAAKKVTIDARNSLTTSYNTSAISAALGAGAIGVGVNTIDTAVVTQVSGSKIKAQNVDIKADEQRTLNQTAINAAVGGMGLSANVLVNNIGTAIAETGTYNGADYDISDVLRNVDTAIGEQNTRSENVSQNATKDIIGNGTDITDGFDAQLKGSDEYANDNNSVIGNANVSSSAGLKSEALNNGLTAIDRGGTSNAALTGVQVKISGNSEITATNNADINANTTTNTNITAGGATVGGTAASGTFSVLNVKRNSGVTVENSKIAAKEIAIASKQAGTANMNIYQGTIGGAAINVAVGIASLTGENKVTLNKATLIGGTDETDGKDPKTSINVKAEDTSAVDVNVNGGTVGMTALGVLWSDASNTSENTVSVNTSTLRAAKDVYETEVDENKNKIEKLIGYTDLNNIDIAAVKANTISAKTIGGAVGASSAQGVVAKATDSGSSKVTVTGNNSFIGNVVNIKAQNNPAVKAEAQAYSGALLASAGATIAQAKADGTVEVNIDEGSEFTAKTVNAEASVGTQNGKANVEAKTIGGSVAGLGNVGFNEASAENSMTVKNNVAKNTYVGVEDLNIIADNASVIKADVFGVTIGGALSIANNLAKTTTKLTTNVSAAGTNDKVETDEFGNQTIISSLGNVNIKGAGYGDVTNSVNGNGGGLVTISPIAAKAENELTTDTNVNVSGTWNNIGSMTANATNSDNLDIDADSVTAAVIGASGTQINNTVKHEANVNVTGSVISDGKQSYNASNTVNHDVDLKGNGYGVGVGAAAEMTNTLSYTAKVNMNNATLKGVGNSGAIEALASTSGKMDYDNILKSAGLVAGTFAHSNNTLTYDNGISLTNANLSTAKLDQDITLAATDETKANFETMADTQGGAIGASGATTTNTLTRNNKIEIDAQSNLLSTNDVNIFAGANANGISSSLNYNVVADAYNKTVVPVGTKPKVDNKMSQNNQVTIAGNVNSVRHVNLKAIKGLTTVAESAREYNIYKGDSGSGSLTSTAFGEQNSHETTDNKVAIAGKVNAGIHNNLELKITGSTTVKNPTNDDLDTGKIDVSKIEAKTGTGQDWFNVGENVGIGVGTIENGLMDRYLELNTLLGQYNSGSDEYKSLQAEQVRIVQQMKANGFTREIDDGKNGTRTEIFSEINIPLLDINDIVISGGNINVDTDTLTGETNLNAQAAGNLSVTNESDLYLKINDLVIKDKGGQIYLNGSSLKDNVTNTETAAPKITVTSSGSKNTDLASAPDIGIFGKVINSTGDVYIENTKYDIAVDGNANISARNITLKADNGSVTQNSNGLLLIGGDPVTKWQFSDSIATKIQRYLSTNAQSIPSKTFNSFDDYKNWLLTESGFGFSETDKNEIRNYKFDDSKGIVAGNNVYISGLNVNIDGLVQSGYKNYKVDLSNDQDAQTKLAELESEYASNKKALTNEEVMANEHYCITTNAGAQYNSTTGVYDYNVRVYYNPATGELLTESIEPNGGSIYITGAISSTGSGKLRAMDGTPDISINTSNIDKDLRVNSITNKNIEGLISIKDTATNTLTEYKNVNGNMTATITDIAKSNVDKNNRYTYSDNKMYYNPKAGTTLSWTGGSSGGQDIRAYEYTKNFVGWGLIKYKTSKDFITNEEVSTGKVETSTSSISGNDPLGKGIIIGVKNSSPEYSVSTSKWTTSAPEPSEIVSKKKYKGTAGKMFGYGKVHYTWTETTGTSTSSTYTIKADKGIDVGFMTGGKGDISITSQKDMLLNGNISNAAGSNGAIGNITLKSNAGSISSVGNARVNADNLTISAANGVDINHGALGGSATINVKSTAGNVTINSDKGNLNFTGGADAGAQGGNLNITAAGNLTTADGTTLNGTRIDFVSGGEINAHIAPGQAPTSSDTMSASVNAKAQEKITLTNNNGDMRLGVIDSAKGDVVLTTSGSFVDAYNDANAGYSDTESKIQSWIDNGLISSSDSDSSATDAADRAYNERINGLDNRAKMLAQSTETQHTAQAYKDEAAKMAQDGTLLEAKKTYIQTVKEANGDQTKINAAYATYEAAQNAYFDQRATQSSSYTKAERELIIGYAEVGTDKNGYGWSKNQLLYAIQDTILNSQPGQKVDPSTTANVIGNNITLNAATGGIGIDTAPTTISYNDLSTLENMKLLAASKAGDLTWDDANNQVIIRRQQPINLELRNKATGVVTVNGRDNVYVSAIKDSTLNFNKVETKGDVKLTADNGINMIGNDGIITGRNLIISSGTGSIGSQDKHIVTKVTGTVDANAGQDIYLEQKDGVLTLLAVAAGKDINIIANHGMKMSGAINDQAGYISSTGGVINLTTSEGSIGTTNEKEYIRIENNGAVVNAAAKDGIYLKGKKQNTMVLGNVESIDGTVQLISEGSVSLGRSAGENQDAVTGVIKAVGNGNINARGDIDLTNGSINVSGDNSEFTLQAVGKVEQNENSGGIVTNTLNVKADKSHLLLSRQNNVRNLNARFNENTDQVIDGVLRFKGINEELNVSLIDATQAVRGDVEIENLTANGKVNIKSSINAVGNGTEEHQGSIDVIAKSNIITDTGTEMKANKDITMTAENGSIVTNGTLNAANNIKLTANNSTITTVGTVTATKGNIILEGKSITTKGIIKANRQVKANATTGFTAEKSIEAKNGDVEIITETGNITTTGADTNITAGNDVKLTASNSSITTSGAVTAGKDAILNGKTGITAASTIKATNGSATINSSGASVSTKDITAGKNVDIDAGKSVTTDNVQAGQNTNLTAGTTITTEGNVKATTGNVSYDAKTGITANGSVTAGNDSSMKTTTGNINTGSTVTAGNDANFNVDENGNVTTSGDVTANKDITYEAKGSITTGGSINSTVGNINLTTKADAGDMTFGGNVKADNGNIGITAKENGNLQFNGNVVTDNGNIDIIVEGNGNVNDNDKLFSATGTKGDENTGNIKLQIKGAGDVDLNEIYATNDASVDVANGNLTLAKIDGNLVAIQLRTEGKQMKVKDIIAGTKIVAKGSNMDLDKIKQRLDADGMLTIVPDGAKDDAPIDNLRIGEISTNTGVRFEHLWLNTGNIHVSDGKFHIDKLVVNDNAHFSNAHMTTAVWGNPPQSDHSDSVFWNNTAVNNPKYDLTEWVKAGTDAEKWMFLHFTEIPNIQRSNGALLDLRNYDYVYNQRFTAVDHLNQLLAENKADEYDINFKPEVVQYFRYDLYDLDELEPQLEEHADPAKIVVEA